MGPRARGRRPVHRKMYIHPFDQRGRVTLRRQGVTCLAIHGVSMEWESAVGLHGAQPPPRAILGGHEFRDFGIASRCRVRPVASVFCTGKAKQ